MKKPSILFVVDKVLGIISDTLYAADDDGDDSGGDLFSGIRTPIKPADPYLHESVGTIIQIL